MITVADQSLDVLLDSLEKRGITINKENSQKKIQYLFRRKQREELVPFVAGHPNERIIGYELQTSEVDIIVNEYHNSHGLGGRGVIGGQVEYKNGIGVELKYTGNSLSGVEEKCKKVEEVFKELYDPFVRAHNEWLAKMTPEERRQHEMNNEELRESTEEWVRKARETLKK